MKKRIWQTTFFIFPSCAGGMMFVWCELVSVRFPTLNLTCTNLISSVATLPVLIQLMSLPLPNLKLLSHIIWINKLLTSVTSVLIELQYVLLSGIWDCKYFISSEVVVERSNVSSDIHFFVYQLHPISVGCSSAEPFVCWLNVTWTIPEEFIQTKAWQNSEYDVAKRWQLSLENSWVSNFFFFLTIY